MSKSSLATINVPADEGNYTKGRTKKIEAVTIHHMAGILTAEACGKIFQKKGRGGSSHYGIGNDGKIASYVDESDTAWTNSNWASNCKSITIEVSNSSTNSNWPVSDKALKSLIKLVADISKRNNLGTLVKGKNVTWHSMFTNTTCPGPYLLSKLDYIISEANRLNTVVSTTQTSEIVHKYKVGDTVTINGVYVSSESPQKLNPNITKGKITRISPGAKNPYLLEDGRIGWVNDDCIVSESAVNVIDELAKDVIRGRYGNGEARKKALGSLYPEVQARVNKMLSGK